MKQNVPNKITVQSVKTSNTSTKTATSTNNYTHNNVHSNSRISSNQSRVGASSKITEWWSTTITNFREGIKLKRKGRKFRLRNVSLAKKLWNRFFSPGKWCGKKNELWNYYTNWFRVKSWCVCSLKRTVRQICTGFLQMKTKTMTLRHFSMLLLPHF